MTDRNKEQTTGQRRSRRELLAGAGTVLALGAAAAALTACGPAEAPSDTADAPRPEDGIGARCVTVLYPNGDDVTFDYDYYRDRHLALIMDLYGDSISRFELRKGLPGPDGSPPPYLATINIWIADMEAFAAAGAEHTQTLIDDVKNFTNTMPVIQDEELYGLAVT